MKTLIGTMARFGRFFSRWLKPDLDQFGLNQLKRFGVDLSTPHSIRFRFYFGNEDSANTAAREIKAMVDEVKIEEDAKGPKWWLCFATRRMVPDYDELVRLRKTFTAVGRKFDGGYVGWELVAK